MPKGHGAVLFTGASASVKGYPLSAPFAMGKFALRGLAQSMARELSPQGIHVAHFVIDGAIRNPGRVEPADKPDSMLDPDAIAATYLERARISRARPGPGKSSCGPGSSAFERASAGGSRCALALSRGQPGSKDCLDREVGEIWLDQQAHRRTPWRAQGRV